MMLNPVEVMTPGPAGPATPWLQSGASPERSVFPATMVFRSSIEPASRAAMPPPSLLNPPAALSASAVFRVTVTLLRKDDTAAMVRRPPPSSKALLPLIVTFVSWPVPPLLSMPPPTISEVFFDRVTPDERDLAVEYVDPPSTGASPVLADADVLRIQEAGGRVHGDPSAGQSLVPDDVHASKRQRSGRSDPTTVDRGHPPTNGQRGLDTGVHLEASVEPAGVDVRRLPPVPSHGHLAQEIEVPSGVQILAGGAKRQRVGPGRDHDRVGSPAVFAAVTASRSEQ
jgi:hypothetical protein